MSHKAIKEKSKVEEKKELPKVEEPKKKKK